VVEQKFIEFFAGDVTSRDLFVAEGMTYEILLLFKDTMNELRICLIEGDRATLLIDTGLRERSNYLRTGDVIRGGADHKIISIKSTQKPASEEETTRFYRIFQSWWSWIRKGENK
jgi:hypothetical protein